MARRRMIEVSIAYDERFNALSEWAQLLYLKILPHTDDAGRFTGGPVGIKARTCPLSSRKPADFARAVSEMIEAGLIVAYKIDGGAVLQFNRKAFERINAVLIKNSTVKSEYPDPIESSLLTASEYIETTCSPRADTCPVRAIVSSKYKAVSSKQKAVSSKSEFVPPELPDVIAYFAENGFPESLARRAYEHYNVAEWKDSRGHQVRNWKQKMISVWFKEENRNATGQRAGNGQGYRERKPVTRDDLNASLMPPGSTGS